MQNGKRIDSCSSVSRVRSSVHTDKDEGSVSIAVLNRHIHNLRKRIRRFEEHFEQEKHYKVKCFGVLFSHRAMGFFWGVFISKALK